MKKYGSNRKGKKKSDAYMHGCCASSIYRGDDHKAGKKRGIVKKVKQRRLM